MRSGTESVSEVEKSCAWLSSMFHLSLISVTCAR